MADNHRRERAIERMLQHGAAATAAPASGERCVDGETLAAWSSGALAPPEAARVETHLADCARCQALLAAFARTEPMALAPAPWWSRAHLRWLVPLATAATVAAIWVAVPQRNEPVPPSAVLLDRGEIESSARPAQSPDAAAEPQTLPADPEQGRGRDERGVPSEPTPSSAAEPGPRAAPTLPPVRPADADRPARTEAAAGREEREAKLERRADESTAGARARERASATPTAETTPPPASPAPARPAESPTVGLSSERQLFRLPAAEITSPGGEVRWRISGGHVERSTRGESWEPVTLPAAAVIVSVHSPAGTIVWLAGKAGALFVSTSGVGFEQLPFVSSDDLVSVVAVDDREATVTTADGRRFRTTDRGRSWSPVP